MSAVQPDLGAFDAPARAVPRVTLPDPLRGERRTLLVATVVSVLAGLVGAALLGLGLQDSNRLTDFLVLAGVVAAPTSVLSLLQVSPAAASRISRFADDNGWRFAALVDSPGHTGSSFRVGTRQQRLLVVRGELHGHAVEIGNLRYRIGSRRAPFIPAGYVAVPLPARLPHVVMTSQRALRVRVAFHPRAEDRVALSTDGALRVYAREETAHVVRSMLTPDALQVFARLSRRYCIEIVDGSMFLHARSPLATGSGRRWASVLADVAEVCALLDASPIWSVLRHQPRRALQSLPRLQTGFDETRVRTITLLAFGALMAVVTLLVVWVWTW
ncbi:hypothetical protein ACFWH7_07750 [Cellulosimicrobium cellulans]|uniref:hypothetical protein n=1 Tax=Cellulosimicrobium cellulans TaxID=1710 RepID=UPI00365ACE9E